MSIDLGKEAEILRSKLERVDLSEKEREKMWEVYEELRRKLLELPQEEVMATSRELQQSFTI